MTNFNQFEKSNKTKATKKGKTPSLISKFEAFPALVAFARNKVVKEKTICLTAPEK